MKSTKQTIESIVHRVVGSLGFAGFVCQCTGNILICLHFFHAEFTTCLMFDFDFATIYCCTCFLMPSCTRSFRGTFRNADLLRFTCCVVFADLFDKYLFAFRGTFFLVKKSI